MPLKQGSPIGQPENNQGLVLIPQLLKDFHDKIYEDYKRILFGDRNVLLKMKELWFYMIPVFSNNAKSEKIIYLGADKFGL